MFTDDKASEWDEAYQAARINLFALAETDEGFALIARMMENKWDMTNVKQNALWYALEDVFVAYN